MVSGLHEQSYTLAYKSKNWSVYNEALKRRGSLTIRFDREMYWVCKPTGKRGRQPDYSNAATKGR